MTLEKAKEKKIVEVERTVVDSFLKSLVKDVPLDFYKILKTTKEGSIVQLSIKGNTAIFDLSPEFSDWGEKLQSVANLFSDATKSGREIYEELKKINPPYAALFKKRPKESYETPKGQFGSIELKSDGKGRARYFGKGYVSDFITSDVKSMEFYGELHIGQFYEVKGQSWRDAHGDYCSHLKSLYIADDVKSIGYMAFYAADALAYLYIGSGVEKIGDSAFYYAFKRSFSPVSITLPTNLKELGESAFGDCPIKSIVIPNGVTRIRNAFSWCKTLESITLPDTLEKLDSLAFFNCVALKEIVIPKSVESVKSPFDGCSSLKSIKFSGTVAEWRALDVKTENWRNEVPARSIQCTDGEVEI